MALSITLSVLLEPYENKSFTAHCLDFDLVADGSTAEEALSVLKRLLKTHIKACIEFGITPYSPAPKEYWELLTKSEPYRTDTILLFEMRKRTVDFPFSKVCANYLQYEGYKLATQASRA